MKLIRHTLACAGLLLLCSCATWRPSANTPATVLPAAVTMNPDAGRGNWLFVTLRLADGGELPCIVDTGASTSVFDKSLEPRLGKRLGAVTINTLDDGSQTAGVYATPRLYWGDTQLLTGHQIITYDFRQLSFRAGQPILGVLGMDCLRHYCLQLDFAAGTLRFLNPRHLNAAALGRAFPLVFEGNRPFLHHVSLTGGTGTHSLIDSGCHADGFVENNTIPGQTNGVARLPECVWDGTTYTNLIVGVGGQLNLLGLRFLARHLVTLDFPKGILYLQPTGPGPLEDAALTDAVTFIQHLQTTGHLPGWKETDQGVFYPELYPNAKAVDAQKTGDPTTWHYKVTRATPTAPWHLQTAWRTDPQGRTIQVAPVP